MTQTSALRSIVGLGLLMAVIGLVLGPMWLFGGAETFEETAAGWEFAWSQRLSWAVLLLLVPVLPALLTARGSRSVVPPLVQVGFAAQSATAFAMGFVAPWLAEVGPHLLSESESGGMFFLAMTAAWVASGIVTVTLAVALYRARNAGRVAPILLGLGAVAVPGAGPLGWGLIGLALALAARRILRSQDSNADLPERLTVPQPA